MKKIMRVHKNNNVAKNTYTFIFVCVSTTICLNNFIFKDILNKKVFIVYFRLTDNLKMVMLENLLKAKESEKSWNRKYSVISKVYSRINFFICG